MGAAFGNPVAQKVIRPPGSPFILGDFRVTCSFACHAARVPATTLGCDVANGKAGEPLLAMTTGTVSRAETFPDGSKVIRIVSDRHPDHEPAVAHCATIEVAKGQHVVEGQRIGTLGNSGTSAYHVHLGLKVLVNGVWVETDIWPFLKQNGAVEDEVLQGANPVVVSNRRGKVLGDNTRFRSTPFVVAGNVLVEFDTGAQLDPDFIVEGTNALGTNKWYGAWGNTPAGKEFGYINVNAVSPLVPIEQLQVGHSDQELADAAKKAAHAAAIDVSGAAAGAALKYPG